MSEMCCMGLAENAAHKNYAKNRHLRTIAELCRAISLQIRHVSTIWEKNLLNSNISSTCPHNMVNFGPLMAEIGWRVWGHHQISVGYNNNNNNPICKAPECQKTSVALASLLHRRRSMEVNQTLQDVDCLVGCYNIYTFLGALAP